MSAMVMAGLAARNNDLGREDATLCRLKARLEAESAIAVAEASFARGRMPTVTRGNDWSLTVSGRDAVARGKCTSASGRSSQAVLRVRFGSTGRPASWDWQ